MKKKIKFKAKGDKRKTRKVRTVSRRPRKRRPHCDAKTRKKAVKNILSGMDTRMNVALRLGVSYAAVHTWVKKELEQQGEGKSGVGRMVDDQSICEDIVRLKPVAWLSDWTIDFKVGESHGNVVCNSCLASIEKGDVCVVIRRKSEPPEDVVGAYCLRCMLVALRDTQKYLSGLERMLQSDGLKASMDLSDLHNQYNCVYRKRKLLTPHVGPLDYLSKRRLLRYLESERLANDPDELRQMIELENRYFESMGITELLRIRMSAFREDEIYRLWKEKGMSERAIGKRFNMDYQTVGTIIERYHGKPEKVHGKLHRLERENRQLRRVLYHFAEQIL